MFKKIIYFIFLCILTSITIFIFNTHREPHYNKLLKTYIDNRNTVVEKTANSFFQRENITNIEIKTFLMKIKDSTPSLAIAAFFENNNILLGVKNNNLIENEDLYKYFIKNYLSKELNYDKMGFYHKSKKYYAYSFSNNGNSLLLLYGHVYPKKILFSIIFENIAIASLFFTLFLIISLKIKKVINKKTKENKNENTTQTPIIETNNSNYDATFIKKIIYSSSIETLFFFKYNENINKNILVYSFQNNKLEKKEGISPDNEKDILIEELKKGSIIIKNNGKNISVPMFNNNKYRGYLNLVKETSFSGKENNDIKKYCKTYGN